MILKEVNTRPQHASETPLIPYHVTCSEECRTGHRPSRTVPIFIVQDDIDLNMPLILHTNEMLLMVGKPIVMCLQLSPRKRFNYETC
jgi:hypothetical protein